MQSLQRPNDTFCLSLPLFLKKNNLGKNVTGLLTAMRARAILPSFMPSRMEPRILISRKIRFGVFEVDLKTSELRKHGLRMKLSEQPFQILAMLLEQPREVITREEFRSRLWPDDTFVDFDHSLNNAVMRLREVIGDSSDNPRFVETLPRRGYRFIAPVEVIRDDPPTLFSPDPPSILPEAVPVPATDVVPTNTPVEAARSWFSLSRSAILSTFLAAAVVLSAIALHYVGAASAEKERTERARSLVVLPLENLSGDKNQDYFADGMTDDLIANLAKIRSLRVISRSTAMAYKGTHKPLSEIARDLSVDAVVEGTIMRVGDRVRITAELVQVSTDRHLWADTYESQIGDILALQNRVSSAIVEEIRINLTPEEKERLARTPAVTPAAYENYLKGRFYWNKRSDENLNRAIDYFEKATTDDPHYALAYAGLADCYGIIGAAIFGTMPSGEAAPKAKAAALKALELDPSLAEAATSLATVKFNYDWDWSGASSEFQRAIQLNPNYATAYQRYSLYLIAMGNFENSFRQIDKARELEPLSISINFSLGWRLYLARQYDRAIQQLRNTLDMDPSYELPHLVLGQAYEQKGDYARAIPELQKAAELSHNTPLMVSGLAHGYAVAGDRAAAEKLLTQLLADSKKHYVSPYYISIIYAGLGKNELATEWLEKAFADRSNGLVFLKVEPELDSLRSNPRFIALQHKLGLPD
jgi:TolB-like protein/DNA-binding winged helix-turn-helix (wHTH) protein/Tfp pilus assembly protein PilF